MFAGLEHLKSKKLTIFRFRHSDEQRHFSYSYALFLPNELWICFPDAAGGGGGGGEDDFNYLENKIKEKHSFKIKREFRDIEYSKLELFLKDKALKFPLDEPPPPLTVLDPIPPYEKVFGREFRESFKQFTKRYEQRDYPASLRDLRALVQESLEIVCQKKKADLSSVNKKKFNIKSLSDILFKEKIIDDGLRSWFDAFSSVANNASHRGFPSKVELEKPNFENRIILTISIGMHLISELDFCLRKPVVVKDGEKNSQFIQLKVKK